MYKAVLIAFKNRLSFKGVGQDRKLYSSAVHPKPSVGDNGDITSTKQEMVPISGTACSTHAAGARLLLLACSITTFLSASCFRTSEVGGSTFGVHMLPDPTCTMAMTTQTGAAMMDRMPSIPLLLHSLQAFCTRLSENVKLGGTP